MNAILGQLARQLSMPAWVADRAGGYQLCIDGHLLQLSPRGTQLLVRSTLQTRAVDLQALREALRMTIAWATHCPQTLALAPTGEVLLEARLEVALADAEVVEQVLAAQVGLLDVLDAVPKQHPVVAPGRSMSVWRP